MLRRLFPHPGLSGFLIAVLAGAGQQLDLRQPVLALILGTAIPFFTAPWWPGRPRLRRPLGLIGYTLIVLYDVVISSFQVAWIVLFHATRPDPLGLHPGAA